MQVDVLNIDGKKSGRTVELPEEIFGVEPNDHVIYLAVKQYLAAQRQGTHKVKSCTSKKVRVVLVREIFVTHCIRVVVPFLDLSHAITISN